MQTTSIEAAAQAAGFPATLFGFTPNDVDYWTEPGLPWISDELLINPNIKKPWYLLRLTDNAMAPRFGCGAVVGVTRVSQTDDLVSGIYLWFADFEANNYYTIGRLQQEQGQPNATAYDGLALSQDNGQGGITCLLEWGKPNFELYRVTHYNSASVI